MLNVDEAQAFFGCYRSEFDSSNWEAFTSRFQVPFVTIRGDGSVHYLQSHGEVRRFFEAVAAAWRQEGYERFTTANFEATPLGKFSSLVTFDWEMLRKDGSLVKTWRQSYQLIDVRSEWKVLVSTFHAK